MFTEIFHSMVTNSGNRILVEHSMFIPDYGNFNNNIGKIFHCVTLGLKNVVFIAFFWIRNTV